MIQQAFGVIGAAYGDEGKGLVTDFLAHQSLKQGHRTVVARFNGGAQAGHTVTLPNGVRHVFHHWGSGALAGASTYLGPRFALHPMLWMEETEWLANHSACLDLLVDSRSLVTVPSDVMINQAVEAARGTGRHGSCGVGFGETCERQEHLGMGLTVGELARMSDEQLLEKLAWIGQHHVPQRLVALGLSGDTLGDKACHPAIHARFVEDCRCLLAHARVVSPNALQSFDTVVFEGAQGLALDEELGDFPFVTRSKTGLPYLVELADEAGIETVKVNYLTRAYTTRHGAGPLAHELPSPPAPRFEDLTNVPNLYQGSLRFAPLNPEALAQRIEKDLQRSSSRCSIQTGLVVTCLDQVDSIALPGGETWAVDEAAERLGRHLGVQWIGQSFGPSRSTLSFSSLAHRRPSP